MRTPGHDAELAAGFLFTEGVVRGIDEIGAVEHCRRPGADGENVVDVRVTGAGRRRLPHLLSERRRVVAHAGCGVCGRRTIASLRTRARRITARWTIDPGLLSALPARLRRAQAAFDETGGIHAAGIFTADGELEAVAEDVGRHNAVDKVIGRMMMLERLPLAKSILTVSGRASYEIVQKAYLAGVPLIAAVSAPSTLAIDLARVAGITLVGFVRDDRFNIYCHERRVRA
jgi:FdhD protein